MGLLHGVTWSLVLFKLARENPDPFRDKDTPRERWKEAQAPFSLLGGFLK